MGPIGAIAGQVLGSVAGKALGGLFGGGDDAEAQMRDQASINWNMQREFLQNQLQWRAADAKAAGIHPVAALGVNPAQGSPVAIGGYGGSDGSDYWAQQGADLGRALTATQSNMERLQERLLETQIEGNEIDNMKRLSDVAKTTGAQVGPAFPVRTSVVSPKSKPLSSSGHSFDGPLVDIDSVDWDSDPVGYLASLGLVSASNLKYALRDLKSWWSRPRRSNSQPDRGR